MLVFLAFAGCAGRLEVEVPEADDSASSPRPDLPGDPLVRELDTGRAHVVRMSEAGAPESYGRLHLSSPTPGVEVSVNGGEELSLPHNLDLPPGPHNVVADCPDATTETYRATVEPGATVHLRVCGRPPRR